MPNNLGNGVSGQFGDAKDSGGSISEVRKWSFNPKANNVKYASNKTSGYKKTLQGIAEASGTVSCVWDPTTSTILASSGASLLTPNNGNPNALINSGNGITLNLYLSATAFFGILSVIDGNTINVDIDTGDVVSIDIAFSATGKWDQPSAGLSLAEDFDLDEFLFVPNEAEWREVSESEFADLSRRELRYDELRLDERRTLAYSEDEWQRLRREETDAFVKLAAQTVLDYQRKLTAGQRREMRLYGHSEAILAPRSCGLEPVVLGTR